MYSLELTFYSGFIFGCLGIYPLHANLFSWVGVQIGGLGELKTILLIHFIGRTSRRWINVLNDITRITCIVRLAAKVTIKWE